MIFFFGWGGKSKEFPVDDTRRLVVTANYFHLFFVFTVTWGRKYLLATWTEAGWAVSEITKEDATATLGGIEPDLHWWWKWSMLIGVGALIAIPTLVSLMSL